MQKSIQRLEQDLRNALSGAYEVVALDGPDRQLAVATVAAKSRQERAKATQALAQETHERKLATYYDRRAAEAGRLTEHRQEVAEERRKRPLKEALGECAPKGTSRKYGGNLRRFLKQWLADYGRKFPEDMIPYIAATASARGFTHPCDGRRINVPFVTSTLTRLDGIAEFPSNTGEVA